MVLDHVRVPGYGTTGLSRFQVRHELAAPVAAGPGGVLDGGSDTGTTAATATVTTATPCSRGGLSSAADGGGQEPNSRFMKASQKEIERIRPGTMQWAQGGSQHARLGLAQPLWIDSNRFQASQWQCLS